MGSYCRVINAVSKGNNDIPIFMPLVLRSVQNRVVAKGKQMRRVSVEGREELVVVVKYRCISVMAIPIWWLTFWSIDMMK